MSEQFETPVEIVASMLARKERSKARLVEAINDGMAVGTTGRHLAHQAGSLLAVEEAIDTLREVLTEVTMVSIEFERLRALPEDKAPVTCRQCVRAEADPSVVCREHMTKGS